MPKNLFQIGVEKKLQEAAQAELQASHLYKHLANQCQRIGLFGAAKYFKEESADELIHYQNIADYMNNLGSYASLPDIDSIDVTIKTLRDAVQAAYDAELELGKQYTTWYTQVDPMTQQFLLQFLATQSNSIGKYGDLLARLDLAGDDRCAILIIDKEMGE